MFSTIINWFMKIPTGEQIAIIGIVVPVICGVIGWIINFFVKKSSASTSVCTDGNNNIVHVASGNITTGIDGGSVLSKLIDVSKEAGGSKKELEYQQEKNRALESTVRRLEEALQQATQTQINSSPQQILQPTSEAVTLAKQIGDDAGPYAQALKAIAMGNPELADQELNDAQRVLDALQGVKDAAQIKLLVARMQNASYAGRPRDALQYCDQLELLAGNDPYVLNEIGLACCANAEYQKVETLYKRSLAICEKTLGPDHPDVAASLNNLAALYSAQGRYARAEPLLKRSLAISEKALGPDHPDVASSLNSLAALYKAQGRYAEAEPLFNRALSIWEKTLGPDHPDVAPILNNLAELYRDQGRYAEAEPLFKRSLSIWEKTLGPDHPHVATSINNLAALYDARGQYAQAKTLCKRALVIDEKVFGPNHPHVAADLNNLAFLYYNQEQYVEAEPLYNRALAICEKALGPNHPNVAQTLVNMAGVYRKTGREKEAEPLEQRAATIRAMKR